MIIVGYSASGLGPFLGGEGEPGCPDELPEELAEVGEALELVDSGPRKDDEWEAAVSSNMRGWAG